MFRKVIMIDVNDFDNLVENTYGRHYSFQQQDGCKPRGVHYFTLPDQFPESYENEEIAEVVNGDEMGVSFKAWLERDPNQSIGSDSDDWYIRLWWHRNFYPHIDEVVKDLHQKGLLEDGEYCIDIDW